MCVSLSLASFQGYTGWGIHSLGMRLKPLSPVSHSWGTSRGTHSQTRGLHCEHTRLAPHQNWSHSRLHSWLQTTEEDVLKTKPKIMFINVSTVLFCTHGGNFKIWAGMWMSLVDQLLCSLSCHAIINVWRLLLPCFHAIKTSLTS